MTEKIDEFNFESEIVTDEVDAALDPRPVSRTIEALVFSDLIKRKIINFINYAKNGNQSASLLLTGCAPKHSRLIADIIANELCVNIRKLVDKESKQGDLAAALTNLSDGDVFYFEKTLSASGAITDAFTEALCQQTITMTIGKGSSARTINLPTPKIRAIISVEFG